MDSYKVWENVDELAFHENAIFLEACARSQVEDSHSFRNLHQTNHLNLPWARNFLDDFALIAAGSGQAPNVTAACLELSQSGGDFLTIRIAKNEDFNSEARLRLSRITQIMNRVRQRDLSIPEGRDLCLSLIATGCQRRILSQIKGAKGLGSLVSLLPTSPIQLNAILEDSDTIHDAEPEEFIYKGEDDSCRNEDTPHLAARRWTEMKQLIDKLQVTSDIEAIKRLACLAYDVRHSKCLRVLLKAHCQQNRHPQIIEKLGKIARFFRSAVSIVHVAASAAVRSKHIKVETVPSVSRSIDILCDHTVGKMEKNIPAMARRPSSQITETKRLLRRWRKYVIHAEMLLLTFYEEHPQIAVATNYIGISKRSCYLCSNFIRFHGTFDVEGQHQQLYCLWTLPKEIKFGSQDRNANFEKALAELQLLLAQRVTEVSVPWYKHVAHLKESVANFSRVTIIPQARSRETFDTVMEADKSMNSIVPHAPLIGDEVDARKSMMWDNSQVQPGRQETTSFETLHVAAKQDIRTKESTLVLTSPPAEEASGTDQAVLRATPTPFAASLKIRVPSLQDVEHELPRQHRRRRRRRKRHNAVAQRSTRRISSRSATTLQTRRPARKKKDAYRRSSFVSSRSPVVRGQHSKRASREGTRRVTVGCSSVILAFLESAKKYVLAALHDGL